MDRESVVHAVADILNFRELHHLAWSSKVICRIVNRVTQEYQKALLFYGFGDVIDEVELLNLATGQTQPLPPLPLERRSPSITVVGCNVFVCGGSDQSGSAVVQVDRLDTIAMTWVPAPPMSTPRTLMVAGVLQDSLYVCGGANGWGNFVDRQVWRSVECFDIARNTWRDASAMNEGRAGAAAICLDDYLYVLGGDRNGQMLSSVERLDPTIGQWQLLPPMSIYREFDTVGQNVAITAIGNHIYVCDGMPGAEGNLIFERFDTAALRWEGLKSPPAMCHSTALLASSGHLYTCGGGWIEPLLDCDECPVRDETISDIQRFDPATGEWSTAASMEWARAGCVALASAASVYVFGGSLCMIDSPCPNNSNLSNIECFDVETHHRYTIKASRWDFESNRRGILAACLCSTPPDAAAQVGTLWDQVATTHGFAIPGVGKESPHASVNTVSAFKRMYHILYSQACASCESMGLELNTMLMQGLAGEVLCRAWKVHQLADMDLNLRIVERLVAILRPMVVESYEELCDIYQASLDEQTRARTALQYLQKRFAQWGACAEHYTTNKEALGKQNT